MLVAALLVLPFSTSCKTSRSDRPDLAPDLPPTHHELLRKVGENPRQGELRVTPESLEFRIRRGNHSIPFLTMARPKFRTGCWREVPEYSEEGYEQESSSDWWVFRDERDAVALEFTEHDIGAWFWDAEAECLFRIVAHEVDLADYSSAAGYYAKDDVQVAYRWREFSRLEDPRAPARDDGVMSADILEEVPGVELLIVEADGISLLAADGRALLQRRFEPGASARCIKAQLTAFERPDGAVYVDLAFETFESDGNCRDVAGHQTLETELLDWVPEEQRFAQSLRFGRTLTPVADARNSGESRREIKLRTWDIAGGTLQVESLLTARDVERQYDDCVDFDRGTQTCLRPRVCWERLNAESRETTYRFEANDGLELKMGEGVFSRSETIDSCPDA